MRRGILLVVPCGAWRSVSMAIMLGALLMLHMMSVMSMILCISTLMVAPCGAQRSVSIPNMLVTLLMIHMMMPSWRSSIFICSSIGQVGVCGSIGGMHGGVDVVLVVVLHHVVHAC